MKSQFAEREWPRHQKLDVLLDSYGEQIPVAQREVAHRLIEKYPCYAKCPPLCHELRALVPLLRVMLDSVKFEKEIANETD
jgi:hypothetical protein